MLYETREELWFHNAHLGFSHGLVMSEQMPSVLAQSNSASAGFYEDSGFRSLIDTFCRFATSRGRGRGTNRRRW